MFDCTSFRAVQEVWKKQFLVVVEDLSPHCDLELTLKIYEPNLFAWHSIIEGEYNECIPSTKKPKPTHNMFIYNLLIINKANLIQITDIKMIGLKYLLLRKTAKAKTLRRLKTNAMNR